MKEVMLRKDSNFVSANIIIAVTFMVVQISHGNAFDKSWIELVHILQM